MIKFRREFFSGFFGVVSLFCLIFGSFNLELNALPTNQNDKLSERIAKDFSKKFCNGLGFGLSKESAMTFAIKENNLTFKNKKGMENLNEEVTANIIANYVVDSCGYPIDLKGEKGINEFKEYYISRKKDYLDLN
tara:strand:+ start:427 stop:831 length:405 start_codon:yes stop_codon:yes gene_type:complete